LSDNRPSGMPTKRTSETPEKSNVARRSAAIWLTAAQPGTRAAAT
jgi:hypothetical protein